MSEVPLLYERLGIGGVCPSPTCWRARIALTLKGVSFRNVPLRFADQEDLLARTGAREVPVLAVGSEHIVGSRAIAEWLEQAHPSPTLSLNSDDEPTAESIEQDLGSRIGSIVALDFTARLVPEDRGLYRESREARYGDSLEALAERSAGSSLDLAFAIGRLEKPLTERRYLAGNLPGWVDIVAYCYLLWIAFSSERLMPELPGAVRDWYDATDRSWRKICLGKSI